MTGQMVDAAKAAAIVFLVMVASCILLPVLWKLPTWIRRARIRLAWRRFWRDNDSYVPEAWERQVRR